MEEINTVYETREEDFLTHQLFSFSNSPQAQRKKRVNWFVPPILGLIIVGLEIWRDKLPMVALWGAFSILWLILYPTYFKWKAKKHFQSYIRDNLSKRFGVEVNTVFFSDYLITSDKTGEIKIHAQEIEKVHELPEHFILNISSGGKLIIPKIDSNQRDLLVNKFNECGWEIIDNTNWRW